jgi:hypothetical protein
MEHDLIHILKEFSILLSIGVEWSKGYKRIGQAS